MSKQRYIDTKFWDDSYIVNLDPIEKLLFVYFLTNPLTNIIGIYEITIKRIAFDTGIDKDMVLKILDRFEADEKIRYKDGWIVIKNFIKHQKDSPSIHKGIEELLKQVPNNLQWSDTQPDTARHSPTQPIGSVPYLNPNPNNNNNLNPNLNLKVDSLSAKEKENTSLINNGEEEQEKKKPNDIEFDFESWSWHGVDENIMDRWTKIFPGVEVNLELMKMRDFFKTHPDHEDIIKQKFKNNYAIYIFNWLERAMSYKNNQKIEGG